MLKKKMLRDIKQNLSQFITIFLMVLIGVMVYVGIEAYMDGMTSAADNFYKNNNIQDLNVMGNLSDKDLDKIKSLDNVKDAEKKLVVNAIDKDNKDKTYLLSFIDSNNISKFHIMDGEKFDVNKKGAWVDNFYAEKNNLKVGDTIKIKYDTFSLEEKILGLINVPDHIYDVKDESELVPNRENFGFVYLSVNEIPESYIKDLVMKEMKITDEKIDSYKESYKSFAWAVAVAPADDPEIAVVAMIPQGESSSNAMLLIREVLGSYFDLDNNKGEKNNKNDENTGTIEKENVNFVSQMKK